MSRLNLQGCPALLSLDEYEAILKWMETWWHRSEPLESDVAAFYYESIFNDLPKRFVWEALKLFRGEKWPPSPGELAIVAERNYAPWRRLEQSWGFRDGKGRRLSEEEIKRMVAEYEASS